MRKNQINKLAYATIILTLALIATPYVIAEANLTEIWVNPGYSPGIPGYKETCFTCI